MLPLCRLAVWGCLVASGGHWVAWAGLVPPVGQVVKRRRFYCCFPFAPFSPLPSLPLPVPVRLCPPLLAWVLGCSSGRCVRLGWAVVQALPLVVLSVPLAVCAALCRLCGLWGVLSLWPSLYASLPLLSSGAVLWGAGAVCAAGLARLAGGAGCWAGADLGKAGKRGRLADVWQNAQNKACRFVYFSGVN